MRIAFCGKGGSGKSTLASLTSRYLAGKGENVLVVDGDINQHLGEALGFTEEALRNQSKLGVDYQAFYEYVRGKNPRIESAAHITESTPAGRGSGFISPADLPEALNGYVLTKDKMKFLAVGGHEESEVGTTCFHKFTGAFGVFLNHLLDTENDFVIGDMCAGADPFASSGLATRFDAIFLVCEPTLKSTGVYKQCKEYGAPYNVRIFVIGNKIESSEDEDFIRGIVGNDYIGSFSKSQFVKNMEKGLHQDIDQLEDANKALLEKVISLTSAIERDWGHYQKVGKSFHKQAAEAWANELYKTDLMDQIDPEFSYTDLYADKKEAA